MITKKTLKKIRKGNYGALIGAISDLIDDFNEDKFDMGYRSCLDDMTVYANQLALNLENEAVKIGKRATKDGESYYVIEPEDTERIIIEFFTNKIKDYGRE